MSQRHRQLDEHADQSQGGLVFELAHFLRHNKKWWLTPILVLILVFGVLIALSGSVAAPFIYTVF